MQHEVNELKAELFAAEVAYQLGIIAKAQHRISCALASDSRKEVLGHLKTLGIEEGAALAYVSNPLTSEQMQSLAVLLDKIQGWRPHLEGKIRALAIAC